jgi:hypothetical protein
MAKRQTFPSALQRAQSPNSISCSRIQYSFDTKGCPVPSASAAIQDRSNGTHGNSAAVGHDTGGTRSLGWFSLWRHGRD